MCVCVYVCRAKITFGLNALVGRRKAGGGDSLMVGEWNPKNAHDLIRYTASKGYKIDSYELGKPNSADQVEALISTCQKHLLI